MFSGIGIKINLSDKKHFKNPKKLSYHSLNKKMNTIKEINQKSLRSNLLYLYFFM